MNELMAYALSALWGRAMGFTVPQCIVGQSYRFYSTAVHCGARLCVLQDRGALWGRAMGITVPQCIVGHGYRFYSIEEHCGAGLHVLQYLRL